MKHQFRKLFPPIALLVVLLLLSSVSFDFFSTRHWSGAITGASFSILILVVYRLRIVHFSITNPSNLLGLVFLIWCSLSWWLGGLSITGGLFLLMLLGGWLLYLVLRSITLPAGNWKRLLLYVHIVYGLIQCVAALFQWIGWLDNSDDHFSVGGLIGNPNVLAISLVIPFLLVYSVMIREKNNRYGYLSILTLFSIVIGITHCRSVWIALPFGMLVFHAPSISYFVRKQTRAFRIIGMIFFLALLSGIGTGLYHFEKNSADGRLLIWKISTGMLLDKPVTGLGLGKFQGAYAMHQREYFKSEKRSYEEQKLSGSPLSPYNDWMLLGTETGWIGLLLGVALFMVLVRFIWQMKNYRQEALAIILALVFISLVNFLITVPVVFFQIVGIVAWVRSSLVEEKKVVISRSNRVMSMSLGLILIGFISWVVRLELVGGHFRQLAEAKDWQTTSYAIHHENDLMNYPWAAYKAGLLLLKEGDVQGLSWLKKSFEASGHYGAALRIGIYYAKNKEYDRAFPFFLEAQYAAPGLIRARYHLIQCYMKQKRYREAKELCEDTLEMGAKIKNRKSMNLIKKVEKIKERLTK